MADEQMQDSIDEFRRACEEFGSTLSDVWNERANGYEAAIHARVDQLVAEAVQAEREACAQLMESYIPAVSGVPDAPSAESQTRREKPKRRRMLLVPRPRRRREERPMDEQQEHAYAAQIEENVSKYCALLSNNARHMAGRLGGRVYLIGSVMYNPAPRDVDVRIVVPDHEFGIRYGMEMKPTEREGYTHCIAWDEDGPTQRWVDETAKLGREWSRRINHNVDLKVWPKSYWRDDLYPTPILLAAPSPARFIYNKYVPDPPSPPTEADR